MCAKIWIILRLALGIESSSGCIAYWDYGFGFLVSDMKPASYSENFLGLKNNVLGALEGRNNTLNTVVMSQSNITKKQKITFWSENFLQNPDSGSQIWN